MKVVILAGGLGTRLSEETVNMPKPMVQIGGHPMLWHIMNIYAHYGKNQFVVALGYKGEMINDYFLRFRDLYVNLEVNLKTGEVKTGQAPPWTVQLIDTGTATMTGGRMLRLRKYLGDDFMMTYGDGVADINLNTLLSFHRRHGKLATVTAVHPQARFGGIELDGDQVAHFAEKSQTTQGWINGGFFVLDRKVLDYIDGDATLWEREPMERLAEAGQLMAYKHEGYWQPMDTLREKNLLESLWQSGQAPWKVWP